MTDWLTQATDLPDCTGARSSGFCDAPALAEEVWGPNHDADCDTGLFAFAYLWRRFGPPWHGSDPLKDICAYVLTTPDPEVWLEVVPCIGSVHGSAHYLVTMTLFDTAQHEMVRRRRKPGGPGKTAMRIAKALRATMQALLAPVFVRDGAINIVGYVADPYAAGEPVAASLYAGLGVPKAAMDERLKEHDDD